ncbi:MAG TPA: hypothetical protein VHL81_14485 [Gemmatimonadales bacterium]|jgi:hypothetical protein|nr:hypothetical protein [Gemmatimonadales bacterium]
MRSERSLPLVIGAALVLALAIWCSRWYSVPDPWHSYAEAVRAYLAAGIRGDSAMLARRSASPQPPAWVRQAVTQRHALVAAWVAGLSGVAGERRGDTVAVVLSAPDAGDCSRLHSVSALFLNHSAEPRLLAIGSACVDRQPLQVLRSRSIPGPGNPILPGP